MPRPSPVRAPATRDQADAYRFGLRRLEAALVRGDPVPLHEQIRTQRRAALGGVALGLLGLCAAALYAVFAPSPDWRTYAVVTGTQSSALYVVTQGNDPRLVPVANLPAARLVLAAIGRGGDASTATAVEVSDADLAAAPRTAMAAVTGADGVQPELTVAPSWALCDQTTPDGGFAGTTVIGGAPTMPPVAPGEGVLLSDADDTTWLVVNGRRHQVDVGDGALLATYGLSRVVPRPAGAALLDLLPEGPELAVPVIPNRGDDAPRGLPGRVGDVLVSRPVGGGEEYFVVLSGGLQRVPEVVARLLRVASGAREPREVEPEVLADARFRDDLDVSGWPEAAPTLLDPAQAPVVCWTWTAADDPAGRIWVGGALPVPEGTTPVQLAQADGPGPAVDAAAVGRGGAVRAVGGSAAATPDSQSDAGSDASSEGGSEGGFDRVSEESADDDSGQEPEDTADDDGERGDADTLGAESPPAGPGLLDAELDGQVWLVSDTGVGYAVADDPTATALGIARTEPAPAALLSLLPAGPPLDLSAAATVVDVFR